MEQYTLLILTKDKVVHMRTFLSKKELLEQQRYFINGLSGVEPKPVDKNGYVWFAEVNEVD